MIMLMRALFNVYIAVSPPDKMKPGVEAYVKKTKVVAYGFDVDCIGKDNCKLRDDFLGKTYVNIYRVCRRISFVLCSLWSVCLYLFREYRISGPSAVPNVC